jgi:hypothetical protein
LIISQGNLIEDFDSPLMLKLMYRGWYRGTAAPQNFSVARAIDDMYKRFPGNPPLVSPFRGRLPYECFYVGAAAVSVIIYSLTTADFILSL